MLCPVFLCSEMSLFFTVDFAYLAVLQLWAAKASITYSLPPFALSLSLLFFLLRPSTLILSLANLNWEFGLTPPYLFLLSYSCVRLFSMSIASLSGMKNLNQWSVCGSRPALVKAYCQFGIPKCIVISLK